MTNPEVDNPNLIGFLYILRQKTQSQTDIVLPHEQAYEVLGEIKNQLEWWLPPVLSRYEYGDIRGKVSRELVLELHLEL